MSRTRLSVLYAVLAVAAVLAWEALTVRYNFGGDWSALFLTGDLRPVPSELAATTRLLPHSSGYDGQWYRYMAYDLFFERGFAKNFDDSRHRYHRFLVPALARLLAFGQDARTDGAYIAVVMLSLGLGVYWSALWLVARKQNPAWGLLFLILPASLTSIERMLVDATLTALFAGFLYFAERRMFAPMVIVACAAALTRETGGFLIAGLAAHEMYERRYVRCLFAALAAAPTALWFRFVDAHTPASSAGGIVTAPIIGLLRRVITIRSFPASPTVETIFRAIDLWAILGLLATIVFGLLWCWYEGPSPATFATALFALLGLILGDATHLTEAVGFGRPVSPLILFVMLRGIASREWLSIAAPLGMCIGCGIFYVSPAIRIGRALLK